jgi:predicted nucleic acid-binding protein
VITYVDTSVLVKLVVDEDGSDRAALIWDTADVLASCALIVVEGRAALASARRAGRLDAAQHRRARAAFGALVDQLTSLEITDALISQAARLAEEESLRGYDAVHLGAALSVGAEVFASSDRALCAAADHRGLHIANPLEG